MTTKISIHVEGVSLSEAVRAIGLSQFTTDELLKELSARGLGGTNLVMPRQEALAATTVTATNTPPTEPPKLRGRPPNKPKTETVVEKKTEPDVTEADGEVMDAEETDPWDVAVTEELVAPVTKASNYTMDDVRAALDGCHKVCGLVTARSKMNEVGGSAKLVDIPAAKFGELIAALNGMVKAAEANKKKAA